MIDLTCVEDSNENEDSKEKTQILIRKVEKSRLIDSNTLVNDRKKRSETSVEKVYQCVGCNMSFLAIQDDRICEKCTRWFDNIKKRKQKLKFVSCKCKKKHTSGHQIKSCTKCRYEKISEMV